MNAETKKTDWKLVKSLLERLKQLNDQEDSKLWEFTGFACGHTLTLEGQKILHSIICRVGFERVVGVVDYGPDGFMRYQIHKEDFQNFVEVLDNLIDIELRALGIINHVAAWQLLKGLAHLLNTTDQFIAVSKTGNRIGVKLEDPLRVYLLRIIITARLENYVSDKLYNSGEICREISLLRFCRDLDIIEDFIKSMNGTERGDFFVFDIGKVDSEMTISEFIDYTCRQQIE